MSHTSIGWGRVENPSQGRQRIRPTYQGTAHDRWTAPLASRIAERQGNVSCRARFDPHEDVVLSVGLRVDRAWAHVGECSRRALPPMSRMTSPVLITMFGAAELQAHTCDHDALVTGACTSLDGQASGRGEARCLRRACFVAAFA